MQPSLSADRQFWLVDVALFDARNNGTRTKLHVQGRHNSMEQSPSGNAVNRSAGQIPCLLRKTKVHHRVHNSGSLQSVLHCTPTCLFASTSAGWHPVHASPAHVIPLIRSSICGTRKYVMCRWFLNHYQTARMRVSSTLTSPIDPYILMFLPTKQRSKLHSYVLLYTSFTKIRFKCCFLSFLLIQVFIGNSVFTEQYTFRRPWLLVTNRSMNAMHSLVYVLLGWSFLKSLF